MAHLHYDITVKGKVQGVAFRHHAQVEANKLNLSGFVRNTSGGDVFIEAEGDEKDLNEFISWCQSGPRLAEVTEVKAELGELKNYKTFEVRR